MCRCYIAAAHLFLLLNLITAAVPSAIVVILVSVAAVIRLVVSMIVVSNDIAFSDNIIIIVIVFVQDIVIVYNIMLVPDDMLMSDNLLSPSAVKSLSDDSVTIIRSVIKWFEIIISFVIKTHNILSPYRLFYIFIMQDMRYMRKRNISCRVKTPKYINIPRRPWILIAIHYYYNIQRRIKSFLK